MKIILLTAAFIISYNCNAQLKPGFDKAEYLELLKICAETVDTPASKNVKLEKPAYHKMVYKSIPTELDNKWDLWISNDNIAVISIRGTTLKTESWLENFFAAMVPARGKLYLSANDTFRYKLAEDKKAAVHIGWLIGMASIAKTVIPRIDSCYKSGIKEYRIFGHSQGGAIAYLLRSYLYYQQQKGKLPMDIVFKTYCSAAPKPGNLYYAYDYEYITRNGWGYTIVNTADWVPEVPLSLQTVDDYNNVNPFKNASAMLSKQPFPQNIVMKLVYNNLRKPSYKLRNRYKQYLGEYAYKMVVKHVPAFEKPDFYNSSNYMRAGSPIVLVPDAAYYKLYSDTSSNVFVHHLLEPYNHLMQQYE